MDEHCRNSIAALAWLCLLVQLEQLVSLPGLAQGRGRTSHAAVGDRSLGWGAGWCAACGVPGYLTGHAGEGQVISPRKQQQQQQRQQQQQQQRQREIAVSIVIRSPALRQDEKVSLTRTAP